MATSVEKLNQSLGKLDFEKLENLKEISQGFANASVGGGALASALEKFSASMGGGKDSGGKGGDRKIIIDLKMNGRQMQQIIVDDMEKVS